MKKIKILIAITFLLGSAASSIAQEASFNEDTYYRLTNLWMGEGRSLDVVNDGTNNSLAMTATGDYSGQYWKISSLGDGYFRLTCAWQGEEKSLDIVNDGVNNKLILAPTGNYSGQYWKIINLGHDTYHLVNGWQKDKSLDCDSNHEGTYAGLAHTGTFSGQYWEIKDITPPVEAVKNLKIGDKAHGGIVFHLEKNGKHGLVCQENDYEKLITWSEAKGMSEHTKEAGQDDWRLPSKKELNLMFQNLKNKKVNHFSKEWYWSDEVEDKNHMWTQNFQNGKQSSTSDQEHGHMRMVRSF